MKQIYALILGLSLNAYAHAQPAAASLTDAQIAKVVMTANDGEVDAAKYAKSKTKNVEIKDFAKMMIDQHKQNDKELKEVRKKASIKTADSDLSKSLKEEAKEGHKNLKSSKEVDKDYINQQVGMHQKVLDTLNTTLIPRASNADLKAFLEKTRDAVSSHLAHAKELQTKFQ